jgi:dolichol-phosphate mannosyltransferase
VITGALSIIYMVAWLLGIGQVRGFTTLALLQLFAISMNAMFLGIMGEYLGRIFDNVRGHPLAVVEKTFESGRETISLPHMTKRAHL